MHICMQCFFSCHCVSLFSFWPAAHTDLYKDICLLAIFLQPAHIHDKESVWLITKQKDVKQLVKVIDGSGLSICHILGGGLSPVLQFKMVVSPS